MIEIKQIFTPDLSVVNRNLIRERNALWFSLLALKNTLMYKDWEEIIEAWDDITKVWYKIKWLEVLKATLRIKEWTY